MDEAQLRGIATSDPPGDVWPTLREVLPFLGSPDPELRDELAFAIVADWVHERDLLEAHELRELLAFALSGDGLRHGIGESDTDTVFARSFAALVVALVLAVDNRSSFLTREELGGVLDALLDYAASERDLRGFVPGKGWAHAAAHVADAFDEGVRSRFAGAAESRLVVHALCSLATGSPEVFTAEEDERIATPLTAAVELGKLTLPEVLGALEDPASRVQRINRKHIARSLYFRLDRPEELLALAAWAPREEG